MTEDARRCVYISVLFVLSSLKYSSSNEWCRVPYMSLLPRKPHQNLPDLTHALKSFHTATVYLCLTTFITLVRPLLQYGVWAYASLSRARVILLPHALIVNPYSPSSWLKYQALQKSCSNRLGCHTRFVCSIQQVYLLALSQKLNP